MYKNQLQELAQRSCFNLPSYSCIREGPDHAPRFKSLVNFNGEIFESPNFCTTLRQAEHSAAEVALSSLSNRGPSHSLAARILDETGVYKNLLQEIAQRVGAPLPVYSTGRSGLGHLPVFTCTVELAGVIFTGQPAKNKKQAEKNAAMAAWSSLKQLARESSSSASSSSSPVVPDPIINDEQEQITIARALLNYRLKEKMAAANYPNAPSPFPKKFPMHYPRPSNPQPLPVSTSKILSLIRPKSIQRNSSWMPLSDSRVVRPQKFPAVDAVPYVPVRHFPTPTPYCRVAQPVTIRNTVPVFSAPPLSPCANRPMPLPPGNRPPQMMAIPSASNMHIAPPVRMRQAVPVFASVQSPPMPVQVRIEKPPVKVVSHLLPVAPAETKQIKNMSGADMKDFAVLNGSVLPSLFPEPSARRKTYVDGMKMNEPVPGQILVVSPSLQDSVDEEKKIVDRVLSGTKMNESVPGPVLVVSPSLQDSVNEEKKSEDRVVVKESAVVEGLEKLKI